MYMYVYIYVCLYVYGCMYVYFVDSLSTIFIYILWSDFYGWQSDGCNFEGNLLFYLKILSVVQ